MMKITLPSYFIEAFTERDIDDNFVVHTIIPSWQKARTLGRSGEPEYLRFDSIPAAKAAATQLMFHDSNEHSKEEHMTPFRIVEVEGKVGKVIWLDSRPQARKMLADMRAPLPPAFRKELENL